MAVRAASVTLHPPRRSGGVILPAVPVNVVLVSEPDPPADQPAVEWLLVTTLPIQTLDEVRQIIQYYSVRWMVELLFRTWKSGCRIARTPVRVLGAAVALFGVVLDCDVAGPAVVSPGT